MGIKSKPIAIVLIGLGAGGAINSAAPYLQNLSNTNSQFGVVANLGDVLISVVIFGLIFGLPAFFLWPRNTGESKETPRGSQQEQGERDRGGSPSRTELRTGAWIAVGVAVLFLLVGVTAAAYLLGQESVGAAGSPGGEIQTSTTTTTLLTSTSSSLALTTVGYLAWSRDPDLHGCGPPPSNVVDDPATFDWDEASDISDRYWDCLRVSWQRVQGLNSTQIVWCDNNSASVLRAGESLGLWRMGDMWHEAMAIFPSYYDVGFNIEVTEALVEWTKRDHPELVGETESHAWAMRSALAHDIGTPREFFAIDEGYAEACSVAFELRP